MPVRDRVGERAVRSVAPALAAAGRAAAGFAAALILVSCTASSGAGAAASPSLFASATPSTPGALSTPDAAGMASQVFDNGLPCPASTDSSLPSGSGCVSEALADLDGDGVADRFVLFAELSADATPMHWRALAVLSTGVTTPAVNVPTGQGVATIYPRVIGAADANGDGRAEVFVKLSAILYHVGGQQIEGVFGVAGGRVRPVTVAGRGRLEFRAGGISRYGDGALCAARKGRSVFLIRHVEQVQPSFWEWTERTFTWRGLSLRLASSRSGHLPLTLPITDPRIDPFYHLRCGAVRA
jgi:hypothetical protein